MYFPFDKELDFLQANRLTPDELTLLMCLLIFQDDGTGKYLKQFLSILHDRNIKVRDLLIRLQNVGIINKYNIPKEGEPFNPNEIPINKIFLKNFYKNSNELGEELFNTYPQFGVIEGAAIPLRGVATKFNSLEEAFFSYGKAIKWNPEKHNEIIQLVKWGGDHNLICKSLAKFIIDRSWEDLKSLKNEDKVNINYDAMRLL